MDKIYTKKNVRVIGLVLAASLWLFFRCSNGQLNGTWAWNSGQEFIVRISETELNISVITFSGNDFKMLGIDKVLPTIIIELTGTFSLKNDKIEFMILNVNENFNSTPSSIDSIIDTISSSLPLTHSFRFAHVKELFSRGLERPRITLNDSYFMK